MRRASIPSALVVMISLAACGGDAAGSPLPLAERVVGAAEAPGSEPDPIETPITLDGLEELEAEFEGGPVYEEDLQAIGEAGFVSAVIDTRFFPSEPGGEHAPGTPHVFTSVYEFETEAGASAAVEVAHRIALRPCPETCAYEISEFDPDVADATGVQAIATEDSIEAIGDDIQPDARYSVFFADGPLVYEVTIFGRPEDVSEEQVEDIASALYERVNDAPLPDGS
jgi:hypothetical protein